MTGVWGEKIFFLVGAAVADVSPSAEKSRNALLSKENGRIHDYELVEDVQWIADNGTGDRRWKVPGVLDRTTEIYNPRVAKNQTLLGSALGQLTTSA